MEGIRYGSKDDGITLKAEVWPRFLTEECLIWWKVQGPSVLPGWAKPYPAAGMELMTDPVPLEATEIHGYE